MLTKEEKDAFKGMKTEEESYYRLNKVFESDENNKGDIKSINLCVDTTLDYEHNDRERRSLCKQLCFGYAYVKKMPQNPFRLFLSGVLVGKNSNGILLNSLIKQGVNSWALKIIEDSIWKIPLLF